ncbi:MAG: putative diheme cytochrome c-type signal-peptide protein [Tardiphaga sp.]|nr:putative diheme cytochrome c-type signal-peptide protein [Tardiphaga sp.]
MFRVRILIPLLLLIVAAAGLAWRLTAPTLPFAADDRRLQGDGDPDRGRLVFAAADCASCHARPGQGDRLRLGGGLAIASPFGTFRVPNISTDKNDGIGTWTTVQLGNALVGGVSPQGAHYYPAFPYTTYAGMTPRDIRDLAAYLRTLPPVSGKAPPHDISLIFTVRRFVGFWKLLFFKASGSVPPPTGDAVRDRGAYLVEALAHCGECHSTRNSLGAIKPDARYAGGPDPEGVGFVPNITPARIGHWSEADIAKMLTNGMTVEHGRVGSSMLDVVTNLATLPQSDRDAIASYIKSLPPRATPQP